MWQVVIIITIILFVVVKKSKDTETVANRRRMESTADVQTEIQQAYSKFKLPENDMGFAIWEIALKIILAMALYDKTWISIDLVDKGNSKMLYNFSIDSELEEHRNSESMLLNANVKNILTKQELDAFWGCSKSVSSFSVEGKQRTVGQLKQAADRLGIIYSVKLSSPSLLFLEVPEQRSYEGR